MLYPGEFALFAGLPGQLRQVMPWRHNLLTYAAGVITAKCLVDRDSSYVLSTMYVEFANVESPEDPVSVPEILPEDLSYYADLASSADRDYLRLQITEDAHAFMVDGYEDLLAAELLNGRIVYGQTTGTEGVHGKPFSADANSKVCGLAIVASPLFSDISQDILYARAYYDEDQQWAVVAGNQIRVPYRIKFTQD